MSARYRVALLGAIVSRLMLLPTSPPPGGARCHCDCTTIDAGDMVGSGIAVNIRLVARAGVVASPGDGVGCGLAVGKASKADEGRQQPRSQGHSDSEWLVLVTGAVGREAVVRLETKENLTEGGGWGSISLSRDGRAASRYYFFGIPLRHELARHTAQAHAGERTMGAMDAAGPGTRVGASPTTWPSKPACRLRGLDCLRRDRKSEQEQVEQRASGPGP